MTRSAKVFLTIILSVGLLGTATYLGVGFVLHNLLSDVTQGCQNRENRPDFFVDNSNYFERPGADYSAYFMERYETVTLPSREAGINLSGWYIPGESNGPAVIIVHGFTSCKYSTGNLIQAGMLNRAGYAVLVMDMRDSGDSDFEDGRSAIGNEEYLDVLGGFDWLQSEKGHTADEIGVVGNSLGAATALIAFAQEPELPAVFVDSPFDNLPQIIREELDRESYPRFLYTAGIIAARLRGDNILFSDPHDAITNANGRPIFITHGTADSRIGVHHSYQLRDRAETLGVDATFWILEGYDHTKALGQMSAAYETELVAFFDTAIR